MIHPRFLAATVGRLGRGGNTWTRIRPSGNGIQAAAGSTTGNITVYAWKAGDLRTAMGLPQTMLADTTWYVGGKNDVDLQPGDVLTSAAEPGFVLTIQGPADDVLPGLTLWRAEQRG